MNDWLARYRGYVALAFVLIVAFSGFTYFTRRTDPRPILIITSTPRPSPMPLPSPTPSTLVVQVNGAVARPGLLRLPDGARVDDAIKAAGGFAPDADAARVNLAKRLGDGELVLVPRLGEPTTAANTAGPRPTATATATLAPVNINTATLDDLDKLPGVGPTTAQRIIEYRQANGPFQKPEDLLKVRGIGPAQFDALKHLIVVR